MKTKIQIKSVFGKLLFEYEKENNTIKDTLLKAIESNSDLSNANLSHSDLRFTNLNNNDLRYADLSCSDLSNANLSHSDLSKADLSNADLRHSDLRFANLSNADLRGADLRDALNTETAILPIFCKWSYGIKGDEILIGCKWKTIEEWDLFFEGTEEYITKRNTAEFKQIEAVYNALKYYLLTLNK